MSKIKRGFITLVLSNLIMTTSLLHAQDFEETGHKRWAQDVSGLHYVESEGGGSIRAVAFSDASTGIPRVVLHVKDKDCTAAGVSHEAEPAIVNGVSIRVVSTCVTKGFAILGAKTKDGAMYVHTQFLTANEVEVGHGIFTFTTVGYDKIYNQQSTAL